MNTKWVLGHKVTPHDTSGDYDLMFAETPPKVQGPPPHLLHTFKESFLIIEGEMEIILKERSFAAKVKKDLANLFTILMGIEPLIVSKDVCGLNNDESVELMKWGMELLLKGFSISKSKK